MSTEKEVEGFLVSKTNSKGVITYCNKAFIEISGFSEAELLGKPHSIVRHPDMPKSIFKFLWNEIQAKREVNVFVKNLSKCGAYYWVFANVTPSVDIYDAITGYYSVRRKPNKKAIEIVSDLYKNIQEIESKGGINEGLAYFNDFFEKKNLSYQNFVLHLQIGDE